VAPKDKKIFALALSPFLHQGVTIIGSILPKPLLVLWCILKVLGSYVEVFSADTEISTLAPDRLHKLTDSIVFQVHS